MNNMREAQIRYDNKEPADDSLYNAAINAHLHFYLQEMIDLVILNDESLNYETGADVDLQAVIDSFEGEALLADMAFMFSEDNAKSADVGHAFLQRLRKRTEKLILDNLNTWGEIPNQYKFDNAA